MVNPVDWKLNPPGSIPGKRQPLIPRVPHPSKHKFRKIDCLHPYFLRHPLWSDTPRRNLWWTRETSSDKTELQIEALKIQMLKRNYNISGPQGHSWSSDFSTECSLWSVNSFNSFNILQPSLYGMFWLIRARNPGSFFSKPKPFTNK